MMSHLVRNSLPMLGIVGSNVRSLFHSVPHPNRIQILRPFLSHRSLSSTPTSNVDLAHTIRDGRLIWKRPPTSVLIVKKNDDPVVTQALGIIASHFRRMKMVTFVESAAADDDAQSDTFSPGSTHVDLVCCLGGDGTILHVSSLFAKSATPPVISFSMGTLGFLMPFRFEEYIDSIDCVLGGESFVTQRLRLVCDVIPRDVFEEYYLNSSTAMMRSPFEEYSVGAGSSSALFSTFNSNFASSDSRVPINEESGAMELDRIEQGTTFVAINEAMIHRGRSLHPLMLDCYLNDEVLTVSEADGLLVASPTGSTAYSLSCGGSIIHPSIQCMALTPVCPRSLSFRPLLLPWSSVVTIRVSERSRIRPVVSFDAKSRHILAPGDAVVIRPHTGCPLLTVAKLDPISDWVQDINQQLLFNSPFVSSRAVPPSRVSSFVPPSQTRQKEKHSLLLNRDSTGKDQHHPSDRTIGIEVEPIAVQSSRVGSTGRPFDESSYVEDDFFDASEFSDSSNDKDCVSLAQTQNHQSHGRNSAKKVTYLSQDSQSVLRMIEQEHESDSSRYSTLDEIMYMAGLPKTKATSEESSSSEKSSTDDLSSKTRSSSHEKNK